MELNEAQRYFIEEHVEDFREGFIMRRELVRRVTLIAGGATAAAAILAACDMTPRPASGSAPAASAAPSATPVPSPSPYATPPAQVSTTGITVQPTDPRIAASTPDVKGADGASLMAYMARPAAAPACQASSSSTRTVASSNTSRTSCGGSRPRASSGSAS